MKSVLPLVWSDSVFQDCRQFWEDANSHGVRVGWAQSSFDAKGVAGLLSLARSEESIVRSRTAPQRAAHGLAGPACP